MSFGFEGGGEDLAVEEEAEEEEEEEARDFKKGDSATRAAGAWE